MSDHAHAAGHDEHDEHHGSTGLYLSVFFALCGLTALSFFAASAYWPFHSTPGVGHAFMIAVSCTKALLVILFFMHLIWEANWKYVLTLPAMFMSVFLMLMLVPDIGWRLDNASRERWMYMAVPGYEDVPAPPAADDPLDGHLPGKPHADHPANDNQPAPAAEAH